MIRSRSNINTTAEAPTNARFTVDHLTVSSDPAERIGFPSDRVFMHRARNFEQFSYHGPRSRARHHIEVISICVLAAFNWEGPHAQHAVLWLQGDFDLVGDVVFSAIAEILTLWKSKVHTLICDAIRVAPASNLPFVPQAFKSATAMSSST